MSRLEEEKANLLNLYKVLRRKNITPDRVKRLTRLINEKEKLIKNLEKLK
jgi:hypothetical protein